MNESASPTPVAIVNNSHGFRNAAFIALAILAVVSIFKVSVVSIGDSDAGHIAVIWKDSGTDSLRVFDSDAAVCKRAGNQSFICEGSLALAIQNRKLRLLWLPYSKGYSSLVGGG